MFRSMFAMVLVTVAVGFAIGHFLSHGVIYRRPTSSTAGLISPSAPAAMRVVRAPARSPGYGEIAIAPDRAGNYETDVEIEGHVLWMVVDTGATYVCLTNSDADAIGIRPIPADYSYQTMTANGTGVAAKVRIDRLQIGSLELDDVDAFVMPEGALRRSLLGMSALHRLGGIEISNGMLVLRQ